MIRSEQNASWLTLGLVGLLTGLWWSAPTVPTKMPVEASAETLLSMALLQEKTSVEPVAQTLADHQQSEAVAPLIEPDHVPVVEKPSTLVAKPPVTKPVKKPVEPKQTQLSEMSPSVTHPAPAESVALEKKPETPVQPVTHVAQHNPSEKALLATYRQALVDLLKQHQHYPRMSRKLAEEGSVMLRFVVHASGLVTDVMLLSSSGFVRLDEAAQAIFTELNHQVIPFLEGMTHHSMVFELPIRYVLVE